MQYVDLIFAPDLDTSWTKNPGALTNLQGFVPTQQGYLASIGYANLFGASTLTGGDIYRAQLFRQVNNSVRLLCFRPGNIDEYSNAAALTNRGTGYTGTYWDATAWGNQIIACNATDAVQSSSGAGFAALGGGSGKARYIAANMDQAVLYDVDDGAGYAFPDAVAWSQFRNPSVYTPAPSTQAGRTRLLSVPGPARGIIAYQAGFVAFKDNGFFVGKYVGPQKVMSWVPVSKRIGCIAPFSIVECDGKLYWLHTSGFWCWDGQNLQNVGKPVIQSFLGENNFIDPGDGRVTLGGGPTFDVSLTQAVADDVEGVICWSGYASKGAAPASTRQFQYFYNVRTGRWGRWFKITANAAANANALVRGSTPDMQAFKGDTAGRFWQVWNSAATVMQSLRYPYAGVSDPSSGDPSFNTGTYGDQLQSSRQDLLVLRHISGTDALAVGNVTGLIGGDATEDGNNNLGTKAMSWDPMQSALKGGLDAPFKGISVSYAAGKKIILGGCGIPQKAKGAR